MNKLSRFWIALLMIAIAGGCSRDQLPVESHEQSSSDPLHKPDPLLGYRLTPGAHLMERTFGDTTYRNLIHIGADGLRSTAAKESTSDSRPEIWIFGCSFSFGQGLSDHETYAWLVQEKLPDRHVRNFAVNGYGNVQACFSSKTL